MVEPGRSAVIACLDGEDIPEKDSPLTSEIISRLPVALGRSLAAQLVREY